MRLILFCITAAFLLFGSASSTHAQITEVCTGQGIQPSTTDFQPDGYILTSFDREDVWVYNIAGGNRYPLPETAPCGWHCRLSPDAMWITQMDVDNNYTITKMRLDGTQRTPLISGASDVMWWTPDTLLVWTLDQRAYLTPEGNPSAPREYLDTEGVVSIQPGGRFALTVAAEPDGTFTRNLENLELRGLVGVAGGGSVSLGEDTPYYNSAVWSPDGQWLAFVAPGPFDEATGAMGSELYGIRPGDVEPIRWTTLADVYGSARINGHSIGDLSWSPDSARVAFWVTELIGPDPLANTGNAVIHIYDLETEDLRAYCGYSTIEHTPNPPRLVWSPDGTHLAFGGNIPGDDKGYLLLAMDTQTGQLTELSSGIYPALGSADVIAWGRLP